MSGTAAHNDRAGRSKRSEYTFMAINVMAAKNEPAEEDEKIEVTTQHIIRNLLLFVVGAGLIVIGSNLLINSGSDIAPMLIFQKAFKYQGVLMLLLYAVYIVMTV